MHRWRYLLGNRSNIIEKETQYMVPAETPTKNLQKYPNRLVIKGSEKAETGFPRIIPHTEPIEFSERIP